MKGFILGILLLSLPAAALDKIDLSVALYTLEPLIEFSDSKPKGVVGEALENSTRSRPQITIRYADYSFARFMLMMKHSEHDLGLLVAKTPEREKLFKFTKDHLWVSRPAIIVKKTHSLASIQKLANLKGKKIGHIRGSVIPEELQQLAIDWYFRSESDYFSNAFRSLQLGRVDAFFVPTAVFGRHKLESIDLKQEYSVVLLPLEGIKLYGIYPHDLGPEKVALIEELVSEMAQVTQKAH